MQKFYPLPALNTALIKKTPCFFLFETSSCDSDNFTSYMLFNPLEVISAQNPVGIEAAFKRIEQCAKKYYLAGYLCYELGYYLENIKPGLPCPLPLIHFGVFDRIVSFNHKTGRLKGPAQGFFSSASCKETYSITQPIFNLGIQKYSWAIARLKRHIRNGDTYQVNFTDKYHFSFHGSAFAFYQQLKEQQKTPYSAFCKLNNGFILSLSPELFFKREGKFIYSRPMKGTLQRGKTIEEDKLLVSRLQRDGKNRAENLMIVDLVRNDLGRICKTGSVKTRRMFTIEKYQSLLQMTSTISGILREGVSYGEIFKSIFPGGSVTGAPKIRTMEIIRDLESEARQVYCGALGFILPAKKAAFNLPIRTVYISGHKGEMGTGSGITYDSNPKQEFQECLLKAKFLTQKQNPFSLLETIVWKGGYRYLEAHLRRMHCSTRVL